MNDQKETGNATEQIPFRCNINEKGELAIETKTGKSMCWFDEERGMVFVVAYAAQDVLAYGILEKARQCIQTFWQMKNLEKKLAQKTRDDILRKQ